MKDLTIVFAALCLLAIMPACTNNKSTSEPSVPASPAAIQQPSTSVSAAGSTVAAVRTLPDGLKIEDVKVGTGAEAVAGKGVTVHYTGTLTDGKKFDSSLDHGQPFSFPLGAGRVIKGWDEGVAGMKVGGKRKLTIPPELGYGAAGAGAVIPANATLLFDVELLSVQ